MDNIFILMIEQWQIYLKYHQRMGTLLLKKRVNRDKCSFATKQRMFGVLASKDAPSQLSALYATLLHISLENHNFI